MTKNLRNELAQLESDIVTAYNEGDNLATIGYSALALSVAKKIIHHQDRQLAETEERAINAEAQIASRYVTAHKDIFLVFKGSHRCSLKYLLEANVKEGIIEFDFDKYANFVRDFNVVYKYHRGCEIPFIDGPAPRGGKGKKLRVLDKEDLGILQAFLQQKSADDCGYVMVNEAIEAVRV